MTYFFAGTASPVVARALAAGDLDAFRTVWGDVLPAAAGVLARVNSLDELLVNEVETVHCRRFVDGHVALIGDAAHAMYPNAGQGANSALVDGAVLVGRLRASSDVPSALHAYDGRRRRAVQRVQRDSARVARLSAVRSAPLRRVRDTLLRRTAGRGMSRRRLDRVMQIDPADLYREVTEISGETGTPPPGPISA
jgi:2-polyprenyl-6-methoxyphenol hydroxylase-like FAD-dependent oxidoreductase